MTKSLLIMAAAVLAYSPAAAKDIVVIAPPTERVSFADLDLLSDAGVGQLEARVRTAAGNLCIENTVQPLATRLAERACFDSALADGLEQAGRVVQQRRGSAVAQTASIIIRAR